jgi:mannose-6-phosphate isomerase-like protein (cupin superfamily)
VRRYAVTHVDDLERVPLDHGEWRPVRRPLDITGFSANAYTGRAAGDPVIEPHDETGPGSGRHEELYVVLSGEATFTIDGDTVAAPGGTLLMIPPDARREAVAAAPETTVLVVGGKPGAALPVSPFEHWYAAHPAYLAGDYRRAAEIASAGLRDWPDHGSLHYQLACYTALAGDREAALEHLRVAIAGDPRTREWAQDDADLDSIRDDPAFSA